MLFNKDTEIYDMQPHRDDGYAPTAPLSNLEGSPQALHTQSELGSSTWGCSGLNDLALHCLADNMDVSLLDIIDNNRFYTRPSFDKLP